MSFFDEGDEPTRVSRPARPRRPASGARPRTRPGGTPPHGPDPQPYLELIRRYDEAGFTHVYIHQIGDNQDEFAEFARRELMPAVS